MSSNNTHFDRAIQRNQHRPNEIQQFQRNSDQIINSLKQSKSTSQLAFSK